MDTILTPADSGLLRPKSPRTPLQSHFTLDIANFPSSRQTTPVQRKVSPSIILTCENDMDATPKIDQTPKRRLTMPNTSPGDIASPRMSFDSPNAPSVSASSMPSSLPRPLIRLLFLSTLVTCSLFMMVCVPSAHLPSLHSAAISRRLALAPDGRAFYEATNVVSSWEEARERDYVPPQIKAHHMMKRGMGVDVSNGPIAARQPLVAAREFHICNVVIVDQG